MRGVHPAVFIIRVLCLLLVFPLSGNTKQTDSLLQLPANVEGLRRIDLLNKLSEQNQGADPEKALLYAREAMRLAIDVNDQARLAVATVNLGVIYRNVGQTNKALDAFMDALSVAEAIKNKSIEADALHKIGVTYLLVNEFDDALKYGLEEEKIWLAMRDSVGLANAYNFLGLVYLNLKRVNESYAVLTKSLEIGTARKDRNLMSKPLVNLGDLFLRNDQPDKALEYIEQSLVVSRETGQLFSETVALQKKGTALGKLGRTKEARSTLLLALDKAQQLRSLSLVRNTMRDLAKLNENNGEFKEALANYRMYVALEDSLFSEITKRKIAETVARYEIEKKEQENEALRKEAESRTRQLIIVTVSAAIILVLLLVLWVFYRRQRTTVQALRTLNDQNLVLNEEIQQQKTELEGQNALLEEINLKKDRFFSIFAHDVRASFTGVLGFSETMLKEFDTLSRNEARHMAERILSGTRAVNGLFENLLHWSRLELNEIQATPAPVKLSDTITRVSDLFSLHLAQKNIRLVTQIPAAMQVVTDEYILATIIRNLISNAAKFSHENSEIVLSAKRADRAVILEIRDSGIGMPEQMLQDLFSLDSRNSRPGTQNESGTGIGLHVCKRLADKIGAGLEAESTVGTGTTMRLTLPE